MIGAAGRSNYRRSCGLRPRLAVHAQTSSHSPGRSASSCWPTGATTEPGPCPRASGPTSCSSGRSRTRRSKCNCFASSTSFPHSPAAGRSTSTSRNTWAAPRRAGPAGWPGGSRRVPGPKCPWPPPWTTGSRPSPRPSLPAATPPRPCPSSKPCGARAWPSAWTCWARPASAGPRPARISAAIWTWWRTSPGSPTPGPPIRSWRPTTWGRSRGPTCRSRSARCGRGSIRQTSRGRWPRWPTPCGRSSRRPAGTTCW